MSTSSWATIFPGLAPHPLRGDPHDFQSAGDEARTVATATATVQLEFARIRSGPIDELRGGAAEGLAALVGEIDGSLDDLAPVFTALTGILEHHGSELAHLRAEADAALARAATRWNDLGTARDQHAHERGVLATIDQQLDALRRSPDPREQAMAQIEYWENRRWGQLDTVAWWRDREAGRRADLEESRSEFHRFGATEQALIDLTVEAIRHIPLDELRDPTGLLNAIGDFVGGVGGFANDLVDGAIDLIVDGVDALAGALLTLAEFVMSAALDAVSVAIGLALIALAGVFLVQVFMLLAPIVGTVVGLGLLIFAVLPLPLQMAILAKLSRVVTTVFDSSPGGDLGGTYDMDPIGSYTGMPTDDEAGRAVLLETLRLIDDGRGGRPIEPDEFALVQLDNGKYIVVLPGVTDLSDPDVGLNSYNRTVRDLDQYALSSSTSTGMDDNRYAQMVARALARIGVPTGADVMIVGHSYGADTALDLAADPRFNGTYHVTHVAAAAYHSGPQVAAVPGATNVLVLQNTRDAAVQIEAAGHAPVGAVDGYADAVGDFLSGDLLGGFAELRGSAGHAGATAVGVATLATGGNPLAATTTPGVTQPHPNHTVAVFDGGTVGAGHHPDNYVDYLTGHTSTAVAGFEASVGQGGYAAPGTVYVVDVSVPG